MDMNSMNDDLQQDRRLIMKKIQQRRRSQRRPQNGADGKEEGTDGDDGSRRQSGLTQNLSEDLEDIFEADDYGESFDEELLRDVKEAHREDEQLLHGRIEDGREEGLEAMNHALTSPPTQWWAMRKQWQKRRGTISNMISGMGPRGEIGGPIPQDEFLDGLDASYRSQQEADVEGGMDGSHRSALSSSLRHGGAGAASAADSGVVGHPVMLEDPASMGYDVTSFRQNPNALAGTKRRTPTVIFVSREKLQKRKIQQTMYIIAALCVVFLFMFVLEQRKLSHYAMVESPISLAAYLAGEQLLAENEGKKKVTMDDLGLEAFHGVDWIPQVDFGNVELDPADPLANHELANDPLVGDNPRPPPPVEDEFKLLGNDRFELLRGVVVGWAITPPEVFDNKNSPQYQALHWMAHEDILRYTPDNDHWIKKIVQRYTLAAIYYATNGPGWTNTLFFLSNYDECNWNRENGGYFEGAGYCEGGYITALALWSNNLVGALPPETGALSSLRTLSLFDNKLNMALPKSLVRLDMLGRLYVQRNNFKADLDYLCEMPRLKAFAADCGKRKGVKCSCCNRCGVNKRLDKEDMQGGW